MTRKTTSMLIQTILLAALAAPVALSTGCGEDLSGENGAVAAARVRPADVIAAGAETKYEQRASLPHIFPYRR